MNRTDNLPTWATGETLLSAAQDYWRDALERSVLFLDVLRQRGDNYLERTKQTAPHVLTFDGELLLDGRTLDRPVNYGLVRIVPPADVTIDPSNRPFIVFDPRAGHGPGIGGMKHDSEIGVALRAGHPCYFVGFLPEPVKGQTIADICAAEAAFVRHVAALHPAAQGKPVLIGNCQAGWQIMLMAALNPDLPGPIMVVGSPMSYWAGVRGKNPMRYLGGMLGGTWLTALAGDLGNGIFDGANLIANFEAMHPGNTFWKKSYDVYSKVDTEAERFLEFEKYWGSPILLNADEMQSIADELFVGNKLSSGQLQTPDGVRVDLREIKSPIVVFCSWGDDITPPQQALGWILDLYEHEREIVTTGQTIVYCLHQSIGHLGIFVSGKVASKEHSEFAKCMDLIDLAPPGLYEAVISGVDDTVGHREQVEGEYRFHLEKRTLNDLRALGGNGPDDERRFATAARVSEINLALYRRFLAPVIKAGVTAESAEALRHAHPNRVYIQGFSGENPLMRPVAEYADKIRADRHYAAPENPFYALEREGSRRIIEGWDVWTHMRDAWVETVFLNVYGSPLLQALVGLGDESKPAGRRLGWELGREVSARRMAGELLSRIEKGGPVEAAARAIIYVLLEDGRIDDRAVALLRQEGSRRGMLGIGLAGFKDIVRDQFMMLQLYPDRALETLPRLLSADRNERSELLDFIWSIVEVGGPLAEAKSQRMTRIETLFDLDSAVPATAKASIASRSKEGRAA